MSATAVNRYFVCYSYRPAPEPIDIYGQADGIPEYQRDVLRVFDRVVGPIGLTIYVTWRLEDVPTVGRDVVAVVLGDEWSRTPLFAQDVLATFKAYGSRPQLGFRLLGGPSWIKTLLALKHARALIAGARGMTRRAWAGLRGRVPPIIPIPLGFGNQADLPLEALADRSTDVFFAGSVEHGDRSGRPWYRPRNPKNLARAAMLEALDRLGRARPDLRIRTWTTPSFTLNAIYYGTAAGAEALDVDTYSRSLMDTRICLVPRGTNVETFRFFEALRYGCVAIVEKQPDFPFYKGAPVVEVEDWATADVVIQRLLADPDRMEALHRKGIEWYRDMCSPDVIGRMMAVTVRQELGLTAPSEGPST